MGAQHERHDRDRGDALGDRAAVGVRLQAAKGRVRVGEQDSAVAPGAALAGALRRVVAPRGARRGFRFPATAGLPGLPRAVALRDAPLRLALV